MHLVESYATNCGLKIDKPHIFEKFFPLGFEKYITFETSTDPARDYDYWHDVINVMQPKLEEEGITIVQLGKPGSKQVQGCAAAIGVTNRNQEAYIIKNSLLHFGVDGYLSQLAGAYDKKTVCLYSNNNKNDIKPYWGNPEKQMLIESDRGGKKPSFSSNENPKTINMIKPEVISEAISKLLNLKHDFNYKTLEFGFNYANKIVETVPNQIVSAQQMGISSIIIRMDFVFDEEKLAEQLKHCQCSIVTDKAIDEKLITELKGNIKEVIYYIDEDHDPSFLGVLQRNAVPFALFSDLDEDVINPFKIDYMDYGIIHRKNIPSYEHLKNRENIYYKSSKLTLSNGKMYPSKAAYLEDKPVKDQFEISEIIDNEEFWREADYFYFLEKTP
jgi:hypothetical protein